MDGRFRYLARDEHISASIDSLLKHALCAARAPGYAGNLFLAIANDQGCTTQFVGNLGTQLPHIANRLAVPKANQAISPSGVAEIQAKNSCQSRVVAERRVGIEGKVIRN